MDRSDENLPLEERLRAAARSLPYPPTPRLDLAKRPAPHRRLALARLALLLVALLLALLAVPEVRAAALRLLQVGAPPTPAPFELDLPGRTTLAEAARSLSFPVRLPSEPADLGEPDLVFTQDLGGDVLVLVWRDREHPERARLLLMTLTSRSYAEKLLHDPEQTTLLGEAQVGDSRALWVRGPHLFEAGGGELTLRRVVQGNTLIWTEGELTYRLETGGTLDEALRIARSLR
jgi:hypothetical protein